jgi:hypothetical protein
MFVYLAALELAFLPVTIIKEIYTIAARSCVFLLNMHTENVRKAIICHHYLLTLNRPRYSS